MRSSIAHGRIVRIDTSAARALPGVTRVLTAAGPRAFTSALSFWDGDRCVCALHSYAVHPMSTYGTGSGSSDFPGLARGLLEWE